MANCYTVEKEITMKILAACAAILLLASQAQSETIVLGPNRYEVTAGVTFSVNNLSSNGYLLSWFDDTGAISGVLNPTLVLRVGQTYTFRRVSAKHPLVLADNSLPVSGTDGAFLRTTSDRAVITAAILQPLADFTADPAPTTDAIVWTPTGDAVYYYTCDVPAHTSMTGQIVSGAGSVAAEARSWSSLKALYRQ
jgi:hypothetical protein